MDKTEIFLVLIVKILLTKYFDVLLENVHKSGLTKGECFISYHGFIQEKATWSYVLFESEFFSSMILSISVYFSIADALQNATTSKIGNYTFFVCHVEPLLSLRTMGVLNSKTRWDRNFRIATMTAKADCQEGSMFSADG